MDLECVRDAAAWSNLTATAPFCQSWAYGAAAEQLGARVHRYAVHGGDVAIQCLERRFGPVGVLYAPGGVWGLDDGDAVLRAALAREPGPAVCVAPATRGLRLGRTPDIALCDPTRPRPKRWRNGVARARRQRLHIMDHSGCPDWLWRGQVQLARTRRFVGLPRRWIDAIERVCPGTVRSLGAYKDGVPVAGITILRHGSRWTYQIGWSDPAGRRAGAHPMLLEIMMCRAQEAGVRWFDLGMASPENAGLRSFKLSCGAHIVPAETVRLVGKGRRLQISRALALRAES